MPADWATSGRATEGKERREKQRSEDEVEGLKRGGKKEGVAQTAVPRGGDGMR
jgi:hypothetical protein